MIVEHGNARWLAFVRVLVSSPWALFKVRFHGVTALVGLIQSLS